jgi:hypothetical protein
VRGVCLGNVPSSDWTQEELDALYIAWGLRRPSSEELRLESGTAVLTARRRRPSAASLSKDEHDEDDDEDDEDDDMSDCESIRLTPSMDGDSSDEEGEGGEEDAMEEDGGDDDDKYTDDSASRGLASMKKDGQHASMHGRGSRALRASSSPAPFLPATKPVARHPNELVLDEKQRLDFMGATMDFFDRPDAAPPQHITFPEYGGVATSSVWTAAWCNPPSKPSSACP